MSILRKVPKIEQVLDNMSLESLKRLESLMNSGNGATETYTLFGGENKLNYKNKDLGVWYCNIELERNKSVETGFLMWESETKALFVSYDITQCLKEYEIDLTTYTYVKINEKLSIEEFRRVLEDNINKEVVHIDTTGNVEVGKNLVVDGKVILNGKEDLVDTSGNELISGSSGGGSSGEMIDLNEQIDFDKHTITQSGYNLIQQAYENNTLLGISFILNGLPIKCMFDYVDINLVTHTNVYCFKFGAGETYVIKIKSDLTIIPSPQNSFGDISSFEQVGYDGTFVNSFVSDNKTYKIPYTLIYPNQDTYKNERLQFMNDTYSETTYKIPDLPSDASTKTYTLQTVNGVLTWADVIGDINTILDNINGEVI